MRLALPRYAVGLAEVVERGVLEAVALLLANHRTVGEHRNVFEHGLAAVAKARCLYGGHLQRAAHLVDDERGKSLALHVLGDDQQRVVRLADLLEDRQEVLHIADRVIVDKDVRILEHRLHLFGVGHE
jgi:hypothetical protein